MLASGLCSGAPAGDTLPLLLMLLLQLPAARCPADSCLLQQSCPSPRLKPGSNPHPWPCRAETGGHPRPAGALRPERAPPPAANRQAERRAEGARGFCRHRDGQPPHPAAGRTHQPPGHAVHRRAGRWVLGLCWGTRPGRGRALTGGDPSEGKVPAKVPATSARAPRHRHHACLFCCCGQSMPSGPLKRDSNQAIKHIPLWLQTRLRSLRAEWW